MIMLPITQSGKTKQIYRGHLGPVTSLDFFTTTPTTTATIHEPLYPARKLLISGSWDKSFRVWDTQVRILLQIVNSSNSL